MFSFDLNLHLRCGAATNVFVSTSKIKFCVHVIGVNTYPMSGHLSLSHAEIWNEKLTEIPDICLIEWPSQKKSCIAKCGALDWQAKRVLIVTCVSKIIWYVQIQARLSECLCRSGCGNIPESGLSS